MRQFIIRATLILAGFFVLAFSLSAPLAYADQKSEIKSGINATGDSSSASAESTVKKVVQILSWIVGVLAVIMIMIGGFRYVTSGGKQESVTGAKNTIMYALIGLIIVALAQVIVLFVLNKTTASCVNGLWDSGPKQGESCT